MNIIAALHFSSFIGNMLLITLVLSRRSGALLNRICAILIATFAFWSLFSGLTVMAVDAQQATLFGNMSSFGWCLAPVASLWFYLALAGRERILKNWAFLTICLLIATAFVYEQWSGNMTIENVQAAWGWTDTWNMTPAAYLFYAYYALIAVACTYLIIEFGRKARTVHQKKQARLLIITGLLALGLSSLTDVAFRVFDIRAIPDVADVFFMIWGVGIVYAVSKYGLMGLTPTVASDTILSTISDAIMLLDNNGQIVFTNRAAQTMLGSTEHELLGSVFMSVIGDPKAAADLVGETLQNGSTTNHELAFVSKTGAKVPVLTSTSVVRDSDHNIMGCVVSARDITRRKQYENLILREKDFSNTVIDSLPGLFFIIGTDGRFVRWTKNDLQVTGYSEEDAPNLHVLDLVSKNDRDLIAQKMLEVFTDGSASAEIGVLTKAGDVIPYSISGRKVRIDDKTYLLGMGIDISARKKAEAALQKTMDDLSYSNNELQQFAYIASHDLQEPLRMVSSYVQLLEKRYKDSLDADAHDFIGFAVAGVRRMQNLINDLLAYSRVGTRGKPFENLQAGEACQAAVHNLEVAVTENHASIQCGPLPQVFGDGGQLTQVFQNLIGNAIKYHGEQAPEIQVDAVKKNGSWVFSVRDNGIGIDPKFFERIFAVFQRLHTDEYSGTGIGLSIARKIVQRHGGNIWVESQPGEGSVFYFTIPAKSGGEN